MITIVPQGDEHNHWVTDLEGNTLEKDAEGYYRIATEEPTTRAIAATDAYHLRKNIPSLGEVRVLTILVEFQDIKFEDSENVLQYYQDFLMKPGFDDLNSNGSVHDYFIDNSMGLFDPQFDVVGPVTLSQNESYYGENVAKNDKRPYEMTIEACKLVDDIVDFSRYDNDGDGFIDVVNIIYAGEGENGNPDKPELIWPHNSAITLFKKERYFFEGKILDQYICSCEINKGQKDGIGTICHEFCHTLGLPDDYVVGTKTSVNGDFDLLDSGSYLGSSDPTNLNKEGRCPCALNAYQRYELGWLSPDPLIPNKYNGIIKSHKDTIQIDMHLWKIITVYDTIPEFCLDTLSCMTITNKALIYSISSSTDDPRDGEYYLFENRQKVGWDKFLPSHGMLVWHIDYVPELWNSNSVNKALDHPCIKLVRAREYSNSATAFPSSPREVNQFGATTTPAFLGWNNHGFGSGMSKSLNNIALTGIKEELISSVSATEKTIYFSVTDDGPQRLYPGGYTDIEEIWQDETILIINEKSSQPHHIWRDGQLLIETPTGLFDLQGRKW